MDKRNIVNKRYDIADEYLMNSASNSDCTGLIPSGSCDSAEKFESYNDICDFSVPESTVKKAAEKLQRDGAAPK